jgi:hypothetical protein
VYFEILCNFYLKHFHSEKNWATYDQKCIFIFYIFIFFSDFNETWIFSTEFWKTLKYRISLNSFQWGPSCSCGQTGGHTWRSQWSPIAFLRHLPVNCTDLFPNSWCILNYSTDWNTPHVLSGIQFCALGIWLRSNDRRVIVTTFQINLFKLFSVKPSV